MQNQVLSVPECCVRNSVPVDTRMKQFQAPLLPVHHNPVGQPELMVLSPKIEVVNVIGLQLCLALKCSLLSGFYIDFQDCHIALLCPQCDREENGLLI